MCNGIYPQSPFMSTFLLYSDLVGIFILKNDQKRELFSYGERNGVINRSKKTQKTFLRQLLCFQLRDLVVEILG